LRYCVFTIIYLINGILLALFDRIRVVRSRVIENPAQRKR